MLKTISNWWRYRHLFPKQWSHESIGGMDLKQILGPTKNAELAGPCVACGQLISKEELAVRAFYFQPYTCTTDNYGVTYTVGVHSACEEKVR